MPMGESISDFWIWRIEAEFNQFMSRRRLDINWLNSASMRHIQKSLIDSPIGIHAAVTEKRPVAPHFFNPMRVDFSQQNFLLLSRGLRHHDPERISNKRGAPELNASI